MAIITFRSKAAGEIYMFRETAEEIFKTIGKPLGIRGVITPEEMPEALEAIKNRIEKEKELLKEAREKENKMFREGKDLDKEKTPAMEQTVYFTQRVYPFVEMLELSLKDNVPVTWGVP